MLQEAIDSATLTSRSALDGDLPIDLDGMSWPWLHETLFLQDDPFLDLPVNFESSGPVRATDLESGLLPGMTSNGTVPDDSTLQTRSQETNITNSSLDLTSALTKEADDLVDYATRAASNSDARLPRVTQWQNAELRLQDMMRLQSSHQEDRADTTFMLKRTVEVYLKEFNRLWPMVSEDGFDPDDIHPILYLVIISIGSMYGIAIQRQFGTLLHKRLRRLLTASLFDLEGPEGDLMWLAYARLLTQVQGLYFGQKHGFSYAQVRLHGPNAVLERV